jgi:hypothetical protein
MLRIVIVVAVVAVAFVVAVIAQRRAPNAPARTGHTSPDQLDRNDFVRPGAPLLVAVFTSATCDVCADAWQKAAVFESTGIAVQRIDFPSERALHERYAIDAVPMVLVVDDEGIVCRSFIGPLSSTDLAAAVAATTQGD